MEREKKRSREEGIEASGNTELASTKLYASVLSDNGKDDQCVVLIVVISYT